jgi:hypothetical protein
MIAMIAAKAPVCASRLIRKAPPTLALTTPARKAKFRTGNPSTEPNVMADLAVDPAAQEEFFRRREASGAAERANYSMFLNELCDLLEVPRPDLAGPDDEKNAYALERAVPFPNPDGATAVKRIDLYKRDCFVLGSTPK